MIFKILLCIIVLSLCFLFVFSTKSKSIKKVASKNLAPFGYTLFYTDQNTQNKKENVLYKKILYSEKYNIQGKPDFIYKKGRKYYPIELKSGNIKNDPLPHKGDLLQLIAYFIIIEDIYGYRPKEGKLIYNDYTFIIKNTTYLRKELLKTLKNMCLMLKTGQGEATCSFVHCKYCMCKQTVCDYYENK